MSRTRQFVFAVLGMLLPLAAMEAGIRLYDLARGASVQARTSWYWGYTQDRFLGYRARSNVDIVYAGGNNHLDTNSEGFRDREFDLVALAGKRVIICVGESSTWGTGSTSRDTTWPAVLGQLLAEKDPRFVVLNAGMPGYSTVENVQLLNLRLLKYHPEAILYMGFRNDVVGYALSLSPQTDLNFYPRSLASVPSDWFTRLWMHSSLVGLLVTRLGEVVPLDGQGVAIPPPGKRITARGAETLRDQIALMHTLTSRHGVQLLWVDQPVNYAAMVDSSAMEAARTIVHGQLEEYGIPLLNAHSLYRFGEFPMLDDVHFSDAGNRHLAGLLAPQILERLDSGPASTPAAPVAPPGASP